jgi:hypothetical protein
MAKKKSLRTDGEDCPGTTHKNESSPDYLTSLAASSSLKKLLKKTYMKGFDDGFKVGMEDEEFGPRWLILLFFVCIVILVLWQCVTIWSGAW